MPVRVRIIRVLARGARKTQPTQREARCGSLIETGF